MKDINGFEGLYAVAEDGMVWSYPKTWKSGLSGRRNCFHNGKYLSPQKHSGGYLQVVLTRNKKSLMLFVHRLVAQAYIPNPLNLPEVNHKDTNKQNNHHLNLEWVTRKQNAKHASAHGLYKHEPARGEDHPDAKVTERDVLRIRALREQGATLTDLMSEFPLSKSAMYAVCTGKTWRHIS